MTTAVDIFNNMASRFKSDKAAGFNATVQFSLTGEGGGDWHVEVANGTCQVHTGAAASPKATVRMAASDYVDMTSGKLNPMAAFMSGKVKVEGDLNSVMKFQSVFGM